MRKLLAPFILLAAAVVSIWTYSLKEAHGQAAAGRTTEAWYQSLYVGPVGADTAATNMLQSGTFTATLATGYATPPTGTVAYRITGKSVTLFANPAITGTSNANVLTLTGIPAAAQPAQTVTVPCFVTDNAIQVIATCNLSSGSGTLTFGMGAGFSVTGFTTTGTKGLQSGFTVTYPLS
jgi:hypothetical protein